MQQWRMLSSVLLTSQRQPSFSINAKFAIMEVFGLETDSIMVYALKDSRSCDDGPYAKHLQLKLRRLNFFLGKLLKLVILEATLNSILSTETPQFFISAMSSCLSSWWLH